MYKQLPFAGCKIALLGFKQEEEQEMVEIAIKNGMSLLCACVHYASHTLTEFHTSLQREEKVYVMAYSTAISAQNRRGIFCHCFDILNINN